MSRPGAAWVPSQTDPAGYSASRVPSGLTSSVYVLLGSKFLLAYTTCLT